MDFGPSPCFFPLAFDAKIKTKQKLSHYIIIASWALYLVTLFNFKQTAMFAMSIAVIFVCSLDTSALPERTASVDENSKQNRKVFGICRFLFSVYFVGHSHCDYQCTIYRVRALVYSIKSQTFRRPHAFIEEFTRLVKSSALGGFGGSYSHTNRVARLLFECMGIFKWSNKVLCWFMMATTTTTLTAKANTR